LAKTAWTQPIVLFVARGGCPSAVSQRWNATSDFGVIWAIAGWLIRSAPDRGGWLGEIGKAAQKASNRVTDRS
jgi:hypothetical protein